MIQGDNIGVGIVTTLPGELPLGNQVLCRTRVGGTPIMREGVLFLLSNSELVQAAGLMNTDGIVAPKVLKTSGGTIAYLLAIDTDPIQVTITDSASLSGGAVVFSGTLLPGLPVPINATTEAGITISAITVSGKGALTVSYT